MDRSLICCDFIFVVGASRVAREKKISLQAKSQKPSIVWPGACVSRLV